MSNVSTGAQRIERHAARLAWLRRHPDLLARLPGANDDVDGSASAALADARLRMTTHGLYAESSAPKATRWGIRLLVSELRGEAATKDQRYTS